MSRAVCLRCGSEKDRYDGVCPACGHLPVDEGLLVAWLLSDEHLSSERLDAAAERIRGGQPLRPSDQLLDRARKALGAHASVDPGLTRPQRLALLATSLVLTALPGLTMWAWWRTTRPRTAWQALALSAPAAGIWTVAVGWAWLG